MKSRIDLFIAVQRLELEGAGTFNGFYSHQCQIKEQILYLDVEKVPVFAINAMSLDTGHPVVRTRPLRKDSEQGNPS